MFFFLGKIWPHNRLADPFLDQPLICGAGTKCSYLKHTGGWLRQTVRQCDRYESGSPRGCTQRYRWRSPASCTSDFRFSAHYWRIQDQRKWSLKVQQHGIIGLKFYVNNLGVRHGRVHQEFRGDRIRIELATLTGSISYLTRISARYDYNSLPTWI